MDKQNLIKALEEERDRLADCGHNVDDLKAAIDFLRTGIIPRYIPEEYEVLYAAVHDFQSLYNDYV